MIKDSKNNWDASQFSSDILTGLTYGLPQASHMMKRVWVMTRMCHYTFSSPSNRTSKTLAGLNDYLLRSERR
jgi:hypothetical protein